MDGPSRTGLSQTAAARLVQEAAASEPLLALAAAARITGWRQSDDRALATLIQALRRADEASLRAAGQWLFFPVCDDELALRLQAVAAVDDLLDLAQARPEHGWEEGLADVVGLAGGKALARLAALAERESWARAVVARLPAGVSLAGGWPPDDWLAARRLQAKESARVRRWARQRRWSDLAGLGSDELVLARRQAGVWRRAAPGRALAWPAGRYSLSRLEEMAGIIAAEGAAAAELAGLLSRRRRRVVVLMGNASLGGPPLWAVDGPWQAGMDCPAAGDQASPDKTVRKLAWLRAARLAGPAIKRALWDLLAAGRAAHRGRRVLDKLCQQARPWLGRRVIEDLRAGRGDLALGGPSWEPARARAEETLALAAEMERWGLRATELMQRLAMAGRDLAVRGRPVVLPWADKFAASTLKDRDWAYLAGVVELLVGLDPPPLLLMIDETPHQPAAAMAGLLATAMDRRPGLRLVALGALGGEEDPGDLAAAVLEVAAEAHLVVLRPRPGAHPPLSLDQALRRGSEAGPLVPASRDGAAYLLAGTDLQPLADHGSRLPGGVPDWLLTSRGFAPVGAWLRQRVRALSGVSGPPAGPWRRYQRACNLG